jgi:outer membrane protein assembly factor BamB
LKAALGFFGVKQQDEIDADKWNKLRGQITKLKNGAMSRTSAVAVRVGGTGDVTETHRIWEAEKGVGEVPSPLVYHEYLYMIKNGGVLTVLSAATGQQVYSTRIPGGSGGYYATPVAADGRIYIASDRGIVSVVRAGAQFELLAQSDLGEAIYATPVPLEDILYVRTKSWLYAFQGR